MFRLRRPAARALCLGLAALFSACDCGQSAVKAASTDLAVEPASLDFGLVRTGRVVERQVTLHNRGQVKVTFTRSAEQHDPTDFTGPTAPLSLDPDSSIQITLAYRPSDEGSDQGTWVFENPADNLKITVALRGQGSANACIDDDGDGYGTGCDKGPDCDDSKAAVHPGATEVCGNGIDDDCDPATPDACSALAADPAELDFGDVPVGSRVEKTVNLTNGGTSAVIFSSSALSASAPAFTGPPAPVAVVVAMPTTVTFAFQPADAGSAAATWHFADPSTGAALDVHLKGNGVNPCSDADHDGYGAGCPSGPDCNDADAAVHPGAAEICGNGVDDDCNPATPDTCACPADACPAPDSCRVATGCSMSGTTPQCAYANVPDRTACALPGGGAGLCSSGSCVQCLAATDCAGPSDDYAGCALVACNAGTCSTNVRHDGTGWLSTPALTGEIKIGDNGTAAKALWDGQNFLVTMRLGSGMWGRHVTAAGALVEPAPGFPLDSRYADIAAGGGQLVEVTTDPANDPDATYPNDHVGRNIRTLAGTPVGAHDIALYDGYYNVGRPRVAVADNGYSMIVAQRGTTTIGSTWAPGGGPNQVTFGFDPQWPWRTMTPNVSANASGFAVVLLDEHYYSGCPDSQCTPPNCAEIWGQRVNFAGQVTSPYTTIVDVPWDTPYCTTANQLPNVVSGQSGFLVSSGTAFAQMSASTQVKTIDANFTPGTATALASDTLQQGQDIEMDFDGADFLVIDADTPVDQLPAYRFTEAGARLDAAPIPLSPADRIGESVPRLASNRAGRHLVAYTKSNDNGVYVRLFSTCP